MEKKKNIRFLVCQIAVAIVGLVVMLVNGRTALLPAYVIDMVLIIPTTYFNYSLCKWENKWHSRWNERTPCGGEPSTFRLVTGKVSEWALYILALIIVFLPFKS